jgi:DNA-binding NarL/FixJ family response regulator
MSTTPLRERERERWEREHERRIGTILERITDAYVAVDRGWRCECLRAMREGGDEAIANDHGRIARPRGAAVADRRGGDADAVRVLLVEDHASVREALAAAFEHAGFVVAGQAASLDEARGLLGGVDVAVIDLGLPDGSGAELIGELRKVSPRARVLVLSATVEREHIARAVERGAAGVLSKTAGLDEVVEAVRRVRAGETLLGLGEVVELTRFAGRQREAEHADRLVLAQITPREHEVLQSLAEGLDSRQIADRLRISVRTERNHMANILAKLGVHSQLQALVLALRYDVVEVR